MSRRQSMGHVLIVGGTGMLAELTVRLCESFRTVSVVARGSGRLEALQARNDRINPIPLDYTDSAALEACLRHAVRLHGPFESAVCWIHSGAPDALTTVAGALEAPAVLVHVLGSAVASPTSSERTSEFPRLRYRRVVLGFVIEDERSRWLTDAEICDGVFEAIRSGEPETVVGVVRPWSARPN